MKLCFAWGYDLSVRKNMMLLAWNTCRAKDVCWRWRSPQARWLHNSFLILPPKAKLKSQVCDVLLVNSDFPVVCVCATMRQVSKRLDSSLVITGGAAVPLFLVFTGKKSNREKWANRHFHHQLFSAVTRKKMDFSLVKRKKKSPLPNRLLASYPTRLWTPGCTSRFSTESFWRKKINFLAGSNTVGLFGCVWILSKRSWATVQKKKKSLCYCHLSWNISFIQLAMISTLIVTLDEVCNH